MKRFAKSKLVPEHRYDLWYYTADYALSVHPPVYHGDADVPVLCPPYRFRPQEIIEIVTKLNMAGFSVASSLGSQLCIAFCSFTCSARCC